MDVRFYPAAAGSSLPGDPSNLDFAQCLGYYNYNKVIIPACVNSWCCCQGWDPRAGAGAPSGRGGSGPGMLGSPRRRAAAAGRPSPESWRRRVSAGPEPEPRRSSCRCPGSARGRFSELETQTDRPGTRGARPSPPRAGTKGAVPGAQPLGLSRRSPNLCPGRCRCHGGSGRALVELGRPCEGGDGAPPPRPALSGGSGRSGAAGWHQTGFPGGAGCRPAGSGRRDVTGSAGEAAVPLLPAGRAGLLPSHSARSQRRLLRPAGHPNAGRARSGHTATPRCGKSGGCCRGAVSLALRAGAAPAAHAGSSRCRASG